MADAKLKSIVDRIENVESEQRELGKGKREIYDEAKEAGYIPKALRKIIASRRQKDRAEIEDAMDGYRVALGMAAAAVNRGMSLDDAQEEYGFSRSAIHRESQREENPVSGTAREMVADDLGEWVAPKVRKARAECDFGETVANIIEKYGIRTPEASAPGISDEQAIADMATAREHLETLKRERGFAT